MCRSVCLPVYTYICLSIFVSLILSVYLFNVCICLPVYPSVCLYISLELCFLSAAPSVPLSLHFYVHLCTSPSICLSVYPALVSYILDMLQTEWEKCLKNKFHEINPVFKKTLLSPFQNEHDQVVYTQGLGLDIPYKAH